MPGAVNWVHDDEDIEIRKYLLGEMCISLALQFPARQGSCAQPSRGGEFSIPPSGFATELSSSSEKDDGEGIWWKNKTSHQNS